jgi:hypothetical protein
MYYILETEKKKKKEYKQELTKLQAELTTLKVKTSGWYYFDGSWQLVYYSGIFKSTMERDKIKVR